MEPDQTLEVKPTLKDWMAFISVTLAAGVYAAAWTLPNAILPQMQGDLSVSLDQVSWVVTATVVASAIGIPLTPWLRQRLGAKVLMLSALGLFSVSSIMVASVSTIEEVVLWRVISAFAGSPIIALSQAVTMDIFSARMRALVFSLWSVGMASGWVFAPTIGAWLADLVSWRLTFLSVAPFGFVAFMFCTMFMPAFKDREEVDFDWIGFLSLATALTMFQIVVNQGQRLDWFDSPQILIMFGVGLLTAYIYVVHTIHCPKPFLNWSIFRDRNLVCGMLITTIYAYIGLVPLVLLPSMMEEFRGIEVFTTGVLVLPRGMSQMAAMVVAGFLASRMDPRILLVGGLIVFSVSSWNMSHYNLEIGIEDITWPTIVQGAAMGFIWVPTMALMYTTIKDSLRTSATTLISLTYSLSSSFGVAMAVVILSRSSQINHQELSSLIEPTRTIPLGTELLDDFDSTEELHSMMSEITLQASNLAYSNVFWMLTVSALIILPLAFVLKRPASK